MSYGGCSYGGCAYGGGSDDVTPTQGVLFNTIKDPSGNVLSNVQVIVTLMPTAGFRNDYSLAEVARRVDTDTDTFGYWELPLEANANITPANTWYEVNELIPDVDGGKRVWYVRVAAGVAASVSASQVTSLP